MGESDEGKTEEEESARRCLVTAGIGFRGGREKREEEEEKKSLAVTVVMVVGFWREREARR